MDSILRYIATNRVLFESERHTLKHFAQDAAIVKYGPVFILCWIILLTQIYIRIRMCLVMFKAVRPTVKPMAKSQRPRAIASFKDLYWPSSSTCSTSFVVLCLFCAIRIIKF